MQVHPIADTEDVSQVLRDAAESASDAIVCADTSGNIKFINRKARELFGYTIAEIIGQPIGTLIPEKEIAVGERQTLPAVCKNGKEVTIQLTLSDLSFDGRHYVVALIRDVSEQEAARGKQRLLQAAFEAAAHSTVIATVDGHVVWVNPAFTSMTGYSAEEAIGETTSLLRSGQQNEKFYANLWKTVLAGETWRGTLINQRKDGTFYLEKQAITPVVGATGVIEHFIAVKEDVTEAVQMEHTLRKTHDRYRRLFESSPLAIWEQDYSGVKTYIDALLRSGVSDLRAYFDEHPEAMVACASMINIVDVNKAAIKMAGVASKEALLGNLVSLFSYTSYAKLQEQLVWLAAGNLSHEAEVEITMPGGERLTVESKLNISPEFSASWSEVIVTFLDITERKLREKQLAHSMKMEAVGRLTGGIAHDFNNVLTIISGNLRLITDISAHELSDETKEMIEDVLSAADDGAELTSRLLAFSRKPASRADQVGVDIVVRDFAELIKRTLGSNIDIFTQIADDLRSSLVDVSAFGNVLLNLSFNARDAMSEGGMLTFRCANGMFDIDMNGGAETIAKPTPCVVVEVIDTGSGMSADVIEKATEPFFTTKPIDEGNGLGLSMVQDFINDCGGQLKIDSAPGAGTTITMSLPLRPGGALTLPMGSADE